MSHRPLTRALLAVATVAALALSGCAASPSEQASSTPTENSASSFPVTIEHAFGETVIPEKPQRVVAWGWASADAALALGVIPVAIPFQAYGADANGVLPWIAEKIDELGADTPTVLPDATEAPLEAIAAAKPDVILASYSGITQDEYDLLSLIAPVVAYPDQPWSTPWRDVITTTGTALGQADEARTVVADIDAQVAEQAAAHPEFQGVTIAQVWDFSGTFYVYSPTDPRVEFTEALGFTTAPSVTELNTDDSSFSYTLSHEKLDALSSDLLISYSNTQEEADTFFASAPAQTMQQVKDGAYAQIIGPDFIASVSPPTALSLTWGLSDYVDTLAKAVAGLK
ncbi:iron-siderophore ABC transporter substrate-binding protein [Klugiella xanthotipulae]|uniref:Iron complex transport system substrate-binding protein n=1 Tax=Klugiella xanthotipulae TaxID=244735 RepID=A0A543HZ50_9MICO|nr:iron-siderophore ABC transporter substrate-binding protein [Klugiella xanthotipulae]TQM63622.1 iron complex transport system substrate-binding protein [Klugiella xanthotipulae]